MKDKNKFRIRGTVTSEPDGQEVSNLKVEAWDKDLVIDDLLGSAKTDKTGKFALEFDSSYYKELCFDRKPDIYFKVYSGKKLVCTTEDSVLWNVAKPDIEIDLKVPAKDSTTFQYKISVDGTVKTDARLLPTNISVRVIKQDVLAETELASTTPGIDGRYKVMVNIDSTEPPALFAEALDKEGNILATSAVVFNISDPLTLDIFIPGENIKRNPEYIEIQQSIKLLIGDKPVTDLTPKQLSLIAGKTRRSISHLELYQRAHQVSLSEKISAEILYGLFRRGLSPQLSSLYEQSSLDLRGMLAEAVKENIISQQDEKEVAAVLEKIQRYALNNVLNEPLLSGGPAFRELLETSGVSDEAIHNFVKAVEEHTGTVGQLWKDLEEGKYDIKPEEAAKLQFSIQAGSLSLGHLPMANSILQLKNAQQIAGIKDLVSWSKDQWINYLTELNEEHNDIIPELVPGNTPAEKRSAYARAMSRILEQTYPTESLAAQIEADDNGSLKSFPTFITNNPSFQVGETNIDSYLKENPDALRDIQEPEQFDMNLKKLQLQYMLSPGFDRYQSIKVLQKMNVGSSLDVMKKGWKTFSKQYTAKGGSQEMAGVVYDMAGHNAAMMQNMQFIYGADLNLGTYVTAIPDFRIYLQPFFDFDKDPNLAALFGSQDFCQCKHCRSIYSPAAYMVDLLQFLHEAETNKERFETSLDVLLDRRPDLCHIHLNCDNTNIALPYIDLINEIFETAIYNIAFDYRTPDYSDYQTTGTAEELLAHPEHIREEVYDSALKTFIYPWTLPFDLWTEEGRVYLEHLKLPRYKIIDAFLPGEENAYLTNEAAIDEILGLSKKDRKVILGTTSPTFQVQWGIRGNPNIVDILENPATLLEKSGLEYADLEALYKTWFINPNGNIKTKFDDEHECALGKAVIENITEDVLMKILRFTRLKNKLGWSLRELDMALKTFDADSISSDVLLKLSHIYRLKEYIKAPLYQVLTFWGKIFTGHPNDENNERSPYELLFLNKSVINPVDDAFLLDATGDELKDTNSTIDNHAAAVKAGLGISNADLDTMIDEVLPGDIPNLNLENLSSLYRHVILAKSLGLSIAELLSLIDISGIDPFDPAQTANTIVFCRDYKKIKKAKFKITELEYLLKSEYDISHGIGLSDDAISDALTDIHMGLKKIVEENRLTTDPQGEVTRGKLATILSEENLNIIIAILEQDSSLSEADQTAFVYRTLEFFLTDTADAVDKLVNPSTVSDKQERYEYILKDLLNYLVNMGKKEFLKQKISSNMGLDVDVVDTLLFNRIAEPGDSTRLAGGTLQDNALVTTENQFNTYVLLHKIALILRKFKVTSAELDFLFADTSGWAGWFSFNDLPVTAEGTPTDLFNQLLRLIDLFSFYHWLPAADENLFEVMKDAFNSDPSSDVEPLLRTVSKMTKWKKEDLTELSNNVLLFTKTSYQDEIPFIRLKECMALLKLSGASAVDMIDWAESELSPEVSAQIVHSVRSLYNEDQWLAIARPLRDRLREKQRSALVDWLVYHQAGIKNKYELYSYYLVDPEMSACMLTSRIRLALSSIQLFVQRCLMNLEKEVEILDDDQEHWNQWKWMKTYRLWEANRKIFCYPENWIEPRLRDNKTAFFKELEQELEQGEVNDETVEKACINYLTKLEAVSNMDMMGICRAREREPVKDGYYIFGRTVGKPNILYSRKYQTDATWTSWEKVDIDFEGDHLIPIVYNNKLYIFWPIFTTKTQKAEIPDADEKGREPQKYREIQMAWSVYTNGKWSAKRVTEEKIDERDKDKYLGKAIQFEKGTGRYFVAKNRDSSNNLQLTVYARYGVDEYGFESITVETPGGPISVVVSRHIGGDFKDYSQIGAFTFNPSMKVSITKTNNDKIELENITDSYVINQEFVETAKESGRSSNALAVNLAKFLEKTPLDNFSIIYIDRNGEAQIGWDQPFIYQDNNRTFFIKSSGYHTIYNHYHPYVSNFMNAISAKGVEGLLDPEYDASNPDALSNKLRRQQVKEDFFTEIYGNRTPIVHENLPIDEIDFSPGGAYSIYNWELFFHIPMLIADKLKLNRKFAEAQKWYHYIFDPTDTSKEYTVPKRFWKLKPFMEVYDEAEDGTPASIRQLMKLTNEGDDEMEAQVDAWREDPFNPHLIARMRLTAYQKNVLMKYIDNLLSWGDMLFKQDTMETTNEATQLYMLAWYILGERPKMVAGKEPQDMTYCELQEEGIDDFSNAMVTLETKLIKYFGKKHQAGFNKFKDYMLIPQKNYEDTSLYIDNSLWFSKPITEKSQLYQLYTNRSERLYSAGHYGENTYIQGNIASQPVNYVYGIENLATKAYWDKDKFFTHPQWDRSFILQVVKTLYFCIPQNGELLEYWDIVEDRMFKLRNCMNIEGLVRQLPLFDPPIDPGMLVKAAASGMDLSSALNDLDASLPNYRFTYILEKAKEFAGVVRATGSMLLSVLEKKDAEGMALLRASNEINLLEAIRHVKKFQLEEAQQNRNALQESWNMANDKHTFYESRERVNAAEGFQIGLTGGGIALQIISQIISLTAASTYITPQFTTGIAGWAGSPVFLISTGGQPVGNSASSAAKALNDLASTFYQGASLSGIIAGIQRRNEDWDHLRDQAATEMEMIQNQMEAAETRWKIAKAEIDNHEKQIDQREAEYEYMKSKFTNKELYDWLTGQISSLYFQAYQMAYDLAKRAERSYKYQLADSNDSFISYGYWDSLKKGLLAGEKLQNDLMRMEAAYLEKNKRTYEITKHVSLRMLNPFALMQLRENGKCLFELPEEIFDLDHPGHYMRRIKSVTLTIPCVAGPYSGVNAKLTLESNSIRKNTELSSADDPYPQKTDVMDDRFIYNLAMIQSIATSSGQNDSGLFTLDFNDARYLPFEGAGAISNWQLELPGTFRSFDYNTITDVIITINYTSKDGGEILKKSAEEHLKTFTKNNEKVPFERLFSMKNEFGSEWHRFLNPPGDQADQQLEFSLKKSHFPYLFVKDKIHVTTFDFILQLKNPSLYSNINKKQLSFKLTIPAAEETNVPLTAETDSSKEKYLNSQPVNLNLAAECTIEEDDVTLTLKATEENLKNIPDDLRMKVNDHDRLNREEIEDIFLIAYYCTKSVS
jgi:hypothetical protein